MEGWLQNFGNSTDDDGNPSITSGRDSLVTSILSAGWLLFTF